MLIETKTTEPVLSRQEVDETESVLAFLTLSLLNSLDRGTITAEVETADLASGWAGIAVALAYLHEAGLVGEDPIHQALENAVEDASRHTGTGLFTGPLGFAWATWHLRNRVGLDVASDTSELDECTLQGLYAAGSEGEYDLANGLAGVGIYALERSEDGFGKEAIPLVADALLLNLKESEEEGLRWHNPDRSSAPRCDHPYLTNQIGVAHGNVGALSMLCQAREHLKDDFALDEIISDVWVWLHRQIAAELEGRNSGEFALEWRSGDLGIAAALSTGSLSFPELGADELIERLYAKEARKVVEGSRILGHSLLRGSAGAAFVLGSAYSGTGRKDLRDAAHTTYRSLMSALANTDSVDLRLDSPSTPFPEQRPGPGLLRGAAGIALALLELVRPGHSDWARILMVSPGGVRNE